MMCPKCQFENRNGAKFCKECGVNLEETCLECGTIHQLGSKFCDECGYKLDLEIETDKPTPSREGARKYVTVLFSDLSGYTAMSEKLDPEEVKDITARLFEDVSEIVSKYEAETHFKKAIQLAKEIGGSAGRTYLDLGLLHKSRKRIDKAKESISEAIKIFEDTEAEVFLKQAREELESLKI